MARMTRKFFTLAPGEEYIGVIRPSAWSVVPRACVGLIFVILPFFLWPSFLAYGVLVGGICGVASFFFGIWRLRDIRRHYLDNGVYVTNQRCLDVRATSRSFHVTELWWKQIAGIDVVQRGLFGVVGYGSLFFRGTDEVGFSFLVAPLWNPELVRRVLPRV
jgi:hypothetical protein